METKCGLYHCLKNTYFSTPNANCLYYLNRYFTYQEVINKVNKLASGLIKLGIKKGEAVTVCLPNIPEAVYLLYAINQIGAINNLVHPLMRHDQLLEIMNKVKSKFLFCLDQNYSQFKDFKELNIKVITCSPVDEFSFITKAVYKKQNKEKLKDFKDGHLVFTDLLKYGSTIKEVKTCFEDAVYLHSGGTTGKAKTIALSSYAINILCAQAPFILKRKQFRDLHMMAVLPMFHGFGLCMGVHIVLANGAVSTLIPKFSSNLVCKYLSKGKINYMIGIPVLYEALLNNEKFSKKNLQDLFICFVGGDSVTTSLIERFNKFMKDNNSPCHLYQGYGLTETVTVCNVNTDTDCNIESVGKCLPHMEAKIVDLKTGKDLENYKAGEIYLSGESLMNGYRFDTDLSDPLVLDSFGKKWLKTGDYGYLDENNYLHFIQRLKRIIKVNGINVFPSEVENLMTSLPEIFQAAAIGKEDEKFGNMLYLYIVKNKKLAFKYTTDELNSLIKEKLGVYSQPKKIIFVDSLPQTLIGKIDYVKISKWED